ncbi:folate transporter 1-like [Culicoides brevitarsis]|uniref:folate transporter 1-like n=1 Tax=Culicoides brevitarsis TaxID=469753 RepID=UPI00307C5FF7
MELWLKISLLLSVFGFLRETKPSTPFFTDFLVDFKNITLDQVLRDVYPIGTYSYMVLAIVAFLITDYLRYKPLIFVSGLTGIITWSLILWSQSLIGIQIAEVSYGIYLATEVSYYTYIYAKVEREKYETVTAHTRSAVFLGRFIGSVLGQILVFTRLMDYKELHYLSLGTQITCTLWVFLLPKVSSSIYFNQKAAKPLDLLKRHTVTSFSNLEVLQWSLWYALGNCGFVQVTSYIQVLWITIDDTQDIIWNGGVEALATLFSVIVTLLAEKIQKSLMKNRSNLVILTLLTAFSGLSLVMTAKTANLYVSYAGYMTFSTLYAFTITICASAIAKKLEDDSFGLVFGINTFVALVMQTVLTVTVVSGDVFVLNIVQQFMVYAGFYFLFAILYGCNLVYSLITERKSEKS